MQALSPLSFDDVDILCANVIRGLAMDGVQKADSGHPGMPMGMASVAHVLWTRFLRHNPADPKWFNRDRFVLSGGHGSMLIYSLLHLAGYDVPMEQLKQFRQLGSLTPGHPEYGVTPGVETTTGPLGQGFATAVGMALAEAFLATTFNRPDYPGRRSLHLRHRRRRRPGRGHQPRGGLAGRPSPAGQADLFLRRQPHQHRRPDLALLQRQRAAALRGVWLARADGRCLRHARHRRGHRGGAGRDGQAVADHLPVAHRLRQPQQAGHRRGARHRRWARRKSG